MPLYPKKITQEVIIKMEPQTISGKIMRRMLMESLEERRKQALPPIAALPTRLHRRQEVASIPAAAFGMPSRPERKKEDVIPPPITDREGAQEVHTS
jgi:hypothetical protein